MHDKYTGKTLEEPEILRNWFLVMAAFLVAQTVKNLPVMQETGVRSLGQKDSLEKGMATHLRLPWTARKSNQSILKEINPEHLLEGLMLKLQYFGHLIQSQLTGKDPDAGKE